MTVFFISGSSDAYIDNRGCMVIPGICCERVISVLSFPKFLGSVAQFKRQSNICFIVSVSLPYHISHPYTAFIPLISLFLLCSVDHLSQLMMMTIHSGLSMDTSHKSCRHPACSISYLNRQSSRLSSMFNRSPHDLSLLQPTRVPKDFIQLLKCFPASLWN